ncbi:MAG: mercuric reductase [Candidatus Binataceae bacterium]
MAAQPLAHAPLDEFNEQLTRNVHPSHWANPTPAPRYNLVVIGAGTAGLIAAAGAAGLGAKVALIERDLMGGDCLNFGCVPSKALLRASRVAASVHHATDFGVEVPAGARVNFGRVMERMRRLRAEISATDSASRYTTLGVDVFLGSARFTGPEAVEVDRTTLRFRKAVVATGARAARPPIPGLEDAGYVTNETIFSLTELPRRLVVIGAGPIGCELSQAFTRFGSEVHLLEAAPQILIREDRDAAERVERSMLRDGVSLVTNCKIERVERRGTGKVVVIEAGGAPSEIVCDEILIGVGRVPAVRGLGLEAAGVAYDEMNGIKINDYLQTTNPRIFACGDVAGKFKFTHMSDATARIVIRNALFFGRAKVSALTVPWCTYTDPEIGHVGLYEADARERGIKVTTFAQELSAVDRAILDGETDGFVKVHVKAGTDAIVGATVVAAHAGEMLSELTMAIVGGIRLGKIAEVIHPYPTQAEAIKKIGDAYNRTRLTPTVKRIFETWLRWTR